MCAPVCVCSPRPPLSRWKICQPRTPRRRWCSIRPARSSISLYRTPCSSDSIPVAPSPTSPRNTGNTASPKQNMWVRRVSNQTCNTKRSSSSSFSYLCLTLSSKGAVQAVRAVPATPLRVERTNAANRAYCGGSQRVGPRLALTAVATPAPGGVRSFRTARAYRRVDRRERPWFACGADAGLKKGIRALHANRAGAGLYRGVSPCVTPTAVHTPCLVRYLARQARAAV